VNITFIPANLRHLASRLVTGGFRRNVAVLTVATASSQAILVLASPILTRLFTSADFGYLQVYLSTCVFFYVIIALRYEAAILLPSDDDTAVNLVALSLCATLLMSILSCGVIAIMLRGAAWRIPGQRLGAYLWIIPVSAFGTGVYQTLNSWALRRKRFRDVAATKLTQTAGSVGAQLVLGFLHAGFIGLLVGDVLGRSGGNVRLARTAWREDRSLLARVSLRRMWSVAVRYRQFPLVSATSTLVNTAGFALPSLLIAAFYGPVILGWFALAARVIQAPAMLIGAAISQVYMVSATRLLHEDAAGLKPLFLRIGKSLLLISVCPTLLVICLGRTLFAHAFGEPWREAGLYAGLLAPMATIGLTVWPLTPTLTILECQLTQLKWDIGRALGTVGGLYAAHALSWSARAAVFTYSVTMAVAYALYVYLSCRAISRYVSGPREAAIALAAEE
jgi:O-antigen/teichoic acid export membrane protein